MWTNLWAADNYKSDFIHSSSVSFAFSLCHITVLPAGFWLVPDYFGGLYNAGWRKKIALDLWKFCGLFFDDFASDDEIFISLSSFKMVLLVKFIECSILIFMWPSFVQIVL